MNDLTPAASLAWKIAAAEASGARHGLIECVHLVIGVLSLEKVAHEGPGAGLPRAVMEGGRRESQRLQPVLQRVEHRDSVRATGPRQAGQGVGLWVLQAPSQNNQLRQCFGR